LPGNDYANNTWAKAANERDAMSINASQMLVGVYYIVTKQSIRGEFQVGDRIRLFEDGTIGNTQAGGWMEEEDIPAATEGMECAPANDSKLKGRDAQA
jgi:hypothetical protein